MASQARQKKSLLVQTENNREISEEERYRMVAEAAYFNAEHHGFQGGDPVRDWFLAEKQIEQQLNS